MGGFYVCQLCLHHYKSDLSALVCNVFVCFLFGGEDLMNNVDHVVDDMEQLRINDWWSHFIN